MISRDCIRPNAGRTRGQSKIVTVMKLPHDRKIIIKESSQLMLAREEYQATQPHHPQPVYRTQQNQQQSPRLLS